MVVAQGITEVPDSEDEPLTSPPQTVQDCLDPPANQQSESTSHVAGIQAAGACELSRHSVAPMADRDANISSEPGLNHITVRELPADNASNGPDNSTFSLPQDFLREKPLDNNNNPRGRDTLTGEKHANESDMHVCKSPNLSIGNSSASTKMLALTSNPTTEGETQSQQIKPQPTGVQPKIYPPSKTPQEVTIDELKAQRSSLISSLAALESVRDLVAEDETSDFVTKISAVEPSDSDIMAAANVIVKKHIKLLHDYNEIKDIGQGLMGLIADARGVRIVEVQDEFGVNAKD